MGRQYVINTGAVTLVAATTKCVLEITASATCGLTFVGLELCFSRSVITTTSAAVEWFAFTTTGTGTARTPQQHGTAQGLAAIVTSVKVNNSVMPTGLTQPGLPGWRIPLPGSYTIFMPPGRELFMPASAKWCLVVNQSVVSGTPVPQDEFRANLFFEQG